MKRLKLPALTCVRCDWTWVPRKPVVMTCPSCRTPYYARPRIRKAFAPILKLTRAGR